MYRSDPLYHYSFLLISNKFWMGGRVVGSSAVMLLNRASAVMLLNRTSAVMLLNSNPSGMGRK
jgi:hypothetical protein